MVVILIVIVIIIIVIIVIVLNANKDKVEYLSDPAKQHTRPNSDRVEISVDFSSQPSKHPQIVKNDRLPIKIHSAAFSDNESLGSARVSSRNKQYFSRGMHQNTDV